MEASEILYNRALRFLAFRPRSEKEVRDNLKRFQSRTHSASSGRESSKKVEEVDSGIVDQVINKLKQKNFINDEEFARWWIEQRTTFRPRGLRLIKIELRQKGIDQEIVEKILRNKDIKILGKDLINKLIEKRLPRYKGLEKREIYQKLGQFLARKGFDYDTIKEAIDEVFKKGV
ncbi:MAG: RecX family transcriptional regulator [Candidatus Levybacteria bacterium]|nr:RecX family transcriptional regulator [Candidatus Levybacteria bacterium]